MRILSVHSGLDNAGKTTIVKQIMNEDVNTVSPTLGFIIKTIDYEGLVDSLISLASEKAYELTRYKLNICGKMTSDWQCRERAGSNGMQGTWEGRRLSDHTGGITLRKPIP